MFISDTELETRVTSLCIILAKLLDGLSEDIMAKVMAEYPAILAAELRRATCPERTNPAAASPQPTASSC
jgi:hypothetical protein